MDVDVLIVGAGLAGSVAARALADKNRKVLLIDQRPHVGGNCHDHYDAHGVLVHRYGPHIFHTNSERIIRWLSRFTEWRFYEHRVLAQVGTKLYPLPINRTTINQIYGLNLNESEVQEFLDSVREPREKLETSEDVVLNSVGRDLCEKFFRGYTLKQWGIDLSELSAGVAARIPTRTNTDDRYFSDKYQFMPLHGYTAMFTRMLDHPKIEIVTNMSFASAKTSTRYNHLVYTGAIDGYYEHRLGELPYRSLRFQHEHLANQDRCQPVGTVNYPNDHAYTRVTEFKHLTGQSCAGTSIVREYPQSEGEPYYPIPRQENNVLFKQYAALSAAEQDVTFVGRLAEYRYYNMDQVVGAALAAATRIVGDHNA